MFSSDDVGSTGFGENVTQLKIGMQQTYIGFKFTESKQCCGGNNT